MIRVISILCGLWLIACALRVRAADRQLICRLLTEQDGLSDNRVTCFFKDREGYMWIGTENGLNRFDGNQFRIYRPGQEKYNISNEFITGIGQDEAGNLWVATKNGLNRLDPEKDSLKIFLPSHSENTAQNLSNSLLWDILADRHKVWLAIDNRDLCYFDTRTGRFSYFAWKDFVSEIFPQHRDEYKAIQQIRPGYPDGIWLGTTMGLFGFDTVRQSFRYCGGFQRADVLLTKPGTDARGNAFALFRQEEQKFGWFHPESGFKLLEKPVRGQKPFGNGADMALWLNSGREILQYDRQSGTFIAVELTASGNHSPPGIRTSFTDKDQDCQWFATAQGCYIYSAFLNLFPFSRIPSPENEIPVVIRHALSADDSTTWLADINGRLVIHKKGGPPSYIRSIRGSPLTECAFLFRDSRQTIWVLARNSIFRYHPQKRIFLKEEIPFPGEKVYTVVREDASGNFWLGTINAGVFILKKNTGQWEKWSDPAQPVPLYVRDILLDTHGNNAWFATLNLGLVRYRIPTGETVYLSKDTTPRNGLLSSNITSLAQGADGVVWIGTEYGGLSRYEGEKNGQARFTTFTIAHGLPENTIYGIYAATDKSLWISTAKGLSRFSDSARITHQWLTTDHHLLKPVRALIDKDSDKHFLLPLSGGVIKVALPFRAAPNLRYPLVISQVNVNDSIADRTVRQLDPRQRNVGFRYRLLRYDSPSAVFYEHMLEGFEDHWKKSDATSGSADYINLSPGSYTFRVRAVDATGNLLSEEVNHAFTISKPFWKRPELWGLVSLAFCGGIYLLFRRLARQVRDEKIINYFATSLYGRNSVEDIFWDIAKNCIGKLGLEDCVIYLYDDQRKVLVQKAAYGPKNPEKREILNPIVIPLGQGITGYAALHGRYVLVGDTTKDDRYILDDQARYSELAVPILVEGKVFGIIDTEHPRKNFYTRRHVRILQKIAGLCSEKLTRYLTEEKLRAAIARDLHDEMGSTLTSINIISKIAIEQRNEAKAYEYLHRIKDNSRIMMDAMSDMVWAINPENDSIQRMIIRLKEFAAEILEPTGMAYHFEVDESQTETKLNLSFRKDLYLILKEAITNAAKYSKAQMVTLRFLHRDGTLLIQVEDDGIGMEIPAISPGNGLKNMKHRAAAINAVWSIHSQKGKGTVISVEFALT